MAEALGRSLSVVRDMWCVDQPTPRRRSDELEFLPAALEVMETPASPVGRAVLWALIALLSVALLGSYVATVDVVAVAQGKVVAAGRSKVIQPLEAGIVRAVHVENGAAVKAGDLLIELDPTNATADRERLASELAAVGLESARLRALLADQPEAAFEAAAGGGNGPAAVTNRALLRSQIAEHQARLAGFDGEIARRRADLAGVQATIAKFERTIPLVRERAEARSALAERGHAPRSQALELQQQLVEQEQDLAVARARLVEMAAAAVALARQREQAVAEHQRSVLTQLAETDRRVAELSQELLKAEQRRGQQTLIAPVDGIVQQLAVYTVGGVVTPAQTLLVIAPQEGALEVEAMILNRDIGFIAPGQDVAVKLETFLFTKYGTISGRVTSVSRDAVQDPKLGPVYPARIALDKTAIDISGRAAPLVPGMVVSAEVKTETRRVIDYLLSPILRYRQESLRER